MTVPRRLVVVFESPLAEALLRLGVEVGFHSVLVEPDPTRLLGPPREHGDRFVGDLAAAGLDEHTDLVLTDPQRPEAAAMLREALAATTRWIGVYGDPERPIGPDIGAQTPAEAAVATLAGLIADRTGRTGLA